MPPAAASAGIPEGIPAGTGAIPGAGILAAAIFKGRL
jgi:hypothetical protein